MPVLNPPSSPQKILVEVPLPQPVGGTTTPSRPAASPTPASVPRPKKPKPDPFKQIKGPPVMILPHAMEQGVEKMQRGGKAIKMERSDHEAMQRNIVGSFQWAGSKKPEMAGHDPVALSVYADMLEEMGHPAATIFQHAADPERQQQGEKVGMSGMFVSPAKAPVDESGVSLSIGRGRKTKQNPSHPIWLHAGFQVDGKYGRVHSVVTPEEAMDIADKVDHFYAGKHPIAAEIRSAAGRYIKAKKKMQRNGQPVKFAADRETLASLARGVQDSLFHGIDHAITPTRILADYLNDHGHDNIAGHLREVADGLTATVGQDHPNVWITRGPRTNNTSVQHRTFRDGDRIIRRTLVPTGDSSISFATIHPGPLPQHVRESTDDAARETDDINRIVRQPVQMGRYRSPAGGMIVRGQFYPGGKMLPKEATEANPQPNKKTDAKANRKKKKKKKRKKKAVWPSYPMGYRGPFNDDDEEGGDGGAEAMRRKGRVRKFAAGQSAGMYPEVAPPIHSVEVKDRKKFSDTLFNKHKGGLVPLQEDSTLAKLHDPESHNRVAFKEPGDNEHFLHGKLVFKDGNLHLLPSDVSEQEKNAYDKGYEQFDLDDQEGLLHGNARRADISIGKQGVSQEERMHALGASDRANFRPHNHSLRMQPGQMMDPMMGQISRDQQEGLVDQHMRDHDFFGNIGKYDPNGRINAGEALRSIFNEHLKRGEEKPFTELADHAAQALQVEHEDPDDGIYQHFNTAKKMNEEVGKGNPTNDPDLEPQAWRSHVQAMIDKHLPESGWASKKKAK
jgi:hypothetical protein